MHRSDLPGSGLELTVEHPRRPKLRIEATTGRRLAVRCHDEVVLLGRVDSDRWGVEVYRSGLYRSPLPPIKAAQARAVTGGCDPEWFSRWIHQFATWLEHSDSGPLHEGAWLLRPWRAPYSRPADPLGPLSSWWGHALVRGDPFSHIGWDGNGWGGVLPLRALPDAGASRVKAYRKLLREGTLPPLLLWDVTALDGFLLLDGHDRLAAALAEGVEPPMIELSRGLSPRTQREILADVVTGYNDRMRDVQARRPGWEKTEAFAIASLAGAAAGVPFATGRTRAWPLRGGASAWGEMAPPEWHSGPDG